MPPEPPRSLCLRHSTCAPAARTVHVRQLNHCIRYFQMPPKTLLTMALITLIVKTFDRDDQTDSKIHQPCAYLQKWRHTQCALLFRVLWDTCGDFVYISNKCFFCLKNKLKIPNRPHTSNNCSELRKSYKQHGYLDKNNSRHTVNFLDVSRHTLNPIEILLSRGSLRDFSNSGSEFPSARHEFLPNYYFHAETFLTTKSDRRGCFKASRP